MSTNYGTDPVWELTHDGRKLWAAWWVRENRPTAHHDADAETYYRGGMQDLDLSDPFKVHRAYINAAIMRRFSYGGHGRAARVAEMADRLERAASCTEPVRAQDQPVTPSAPVQVPSSAPSSPDAADLHSGARSEDCTCGVTPLPHYHGPSRRTYTTGATFPVNPSRRWAFGDGPDPLQVRDGDAITLPDGTTGIVAGTFPDGTPRIAGTGDHEGEVHGITAADPADDDAHGEDDGEAQDGPMAEAVAFFYEHGAHSYNHATETPEQGRLRCAQASAAAERRLALNPDLSIEWSQDPNADESYLDQDCFAEAQEGETKSVREAFEDGDYVHMQADLYRGDEMIASLGSIGLKRDWRSDPYRRVIEADLAQEYAAITGEA